MSFDGFGMAISSSIIVEDEAGALWRKSFHNLFLGTAQEDTCRIDFCGLGVGVFGDVGVWVGVVGKDP